MSIFTRLSDIISANLHALLDRAEDPAKLLGQIIREMETGLATARQQAAAAIAAERRVTRELDRNRAASAQWRSRAREALAAGKEELARRALARKLEHDDLVHGLATQEEAARHTSATLRTTLRALEARLAEARRKQRGLLARHQAARVQQKLSQALAGSSQDPRAPLNKFDLLEEKIHAFEDEVLAEADLAGRLDSLDREFADLEHDHRVEQELQDLASEKT